MNFLCTVHVFSEYFFIFDSSLIIEYACNLLYILFNNIIIRKMTEEFLHHIWKYRLFSKNLYTTDNELIIVVDQGQHNHDAGPDFLNAKIKIEETLWCGNVEIHALASDWNLHGHHRDSNYSNIILHVVLNNNVRIKTKNNQLVPTAV